MKEPPQYLNIKILRGDQEKNWYEEYNVPFLEGRSVLGILQYIFEVLDPTLAFGGSCRVGLCASCLVRVNGKVMRACTTIPKEDFILEPFRHDCVTRDLIVRR